MSANMNLPGPNQKQKNTARANEGKTLGLAASARIKRKGKSSKLFYNGSMNGLAVFQHSSAMALMAMAVVFLFAVRAQAVDVEVRDVVLQEASTAELDETVIPRGTLIFNTANPLDFRLGDGTRLGGWQLYNFAALTSPPSVYNTNILLNGHSLYMGAKYSLAEEGNGFFIRDGTNTVVRIFSEEGGAFDSFSSYVATPTQIVVTVNCRVGDPAPVLEWTASITEPDWQEIAYELVRISEDSVRLTIDTTEIDSAYVRITVVPPVSGAAFAITVSAPSYLVGTNPITEALVVAWNQAASFGDHAAAGYLTAEQDLAGLAAAAQVQTNLNTASNALHAAITNETAAREAAGYLTAETDSAAMEALEDYLTTDSAALLYQPAGSYATGTPLYVETDSAALAALEDYLTTASAALRYQPAGSYATGTPVYAEAVYNGSTERITLGAPDLGSGPEYGEILFGYRENNAMVSLRFVDGDMYLSPTGQSIEAWSLVEGVNVWKGKINDTESARIRADLSPMSASGTVTIAANTTNYFIRPDGETNSVSFDGDGTMIVSVDGTAALTVRTNGNVGVRIATANYPLHVLGNSYCTENAYAKKLIDAQNGSYSVDPNGESILSAAKVDTLTAAGQRIYLGTQTNCWLVTDGTNLFFRNVAGTTNALTSN